MAFFPPTILVLALFLSVSFPLMTYGLSLAIFGVPHVIRETQYLTARFSDRLESGFKRNLALLLGLLIILKTMSLVFPISPSAELVILALLFLLGMTLLASSLALAVGLGGLVALLALSIQFPIEVLLILAFMHNLVPWALLRERCTGTKLSGVIFRVVVIPCAVILMASVFMNQEAGFFSDRLKGIFYSHYLGGVYQEHRWAPAFFRVAVYLQCLHYYTTISLLPKLQTQQLSFPKSLVIGSVAVAACFAFKFEETRKLYSVIASFHAFLEWPLLIAFAIPNLKLPEDRQHVGATTEGRL